jgi:hypothetical protein
VVDRRLGDPYGVGDHLQRRPAHTVVRNEFQRRIQDPRLRWTAFDGAESMSGRRGNHHQSVAERLLTFG